MISEIKLNTEGKRKEHGKKVVLSFILAATLGLSSFTSWAAEANISALQLFEVAFGKQAKNIEESAIKLEASDTQQGITLNAMAAAADEKTAHVLFDICREDKTSFKGNGMSFRDVQFKIEAGSGIKNSYKLGTIKETAGSFIYRMVDQENGPKDRRIFKLSRKDSSNVLGGWVTLLATDLIQYDEGEWISDFDLVKYIKSRPNYVDQAVIPNKESLKYNDRWIKNMDDKAKILAEDIPKNLLSSKKTDVLLYPEVPNWKIDNIGFVDNKLHIKLYGVSKIKYVPKLIDEKGNPVKMLHNMVYYEGEKAEGYYIFDVPNIEKLSKLKIKSWFRKELELIPGKWKIKFKVNNNSTQKILNKDVKISLGNNKVFSLKQVRLSNMSIVLAFTGGGNLERIEPNIKIVLKDGSELRPECGAGNYGHGFIESIYQFKEPTDHTQVDYILVNETKVMIE